jgi:hypothetical protein
VVKSKKGKTPPVRGIIISLNPVDRSIGGTLKKKAVARAI